MEGNKFLCLDGVFIKFFYNNWDNIGLLIIVVIIEFFDLGYIFKE